MSFYHVTPTRNLNDITKQGLIPQIGERSQLIGETSDAIYLFKTENDAHDAMMNWMPDYFDDEPMTLLKVDLPESYDKYLRTSPDDIEIICESIILPEYIEIKNTDY